MIQTRLGERNIETDKVLTFPRGLIGLEKHRRFALLQIRDDSPFLVLQSLSNHKVGLLVADPYSFIEDYSVSVGKVEQRVLKLQNIRQVAVLVTVSIPPGEPENTILNLGGPILVNYESRMGIQVPQTDSSMPNHVNLHQYLHEKEQAREARDRERQETAALAEASEDQEES